MLLALVGLRAFTLWGDSTHAVLADEHFVAVAESASCGILDVEA